MAEQSIAKYIRLSQEDIRNDSLSIENQRLLLDRYILESDLNDDSVLEFVDNGYTGTNFERPAVQEMLELIQNGKVNCIIVKDFSRFGRNVLETAYFIERVFPLYRVRFISIDDQYDSFALNGGADSIDVAFKFLINEHYSRDLSLKIQSVKREKALRGEALTKNCAFGYMLDDNRNMVIDPEAAETVRTIFRMYAEGKSTGDIAQRLYLEQRATPAVWKKHKRDTGEDAAFHCVWQKSVILKILRDEQYLGVYTAGKTKTREIGHSSRDTVAREDWIRIPGHHPAIISQELFERVQRSLHVKGDPLRKGKRNAAGIKRYASWTASPLKGKVVCGCCGRGMRISSSRNAAFHCWFTLSAPDASCHKLSVPKSELEQIVLKAIKRQAKIIAASGCLEDVNQSASIPPAVLECERRLEGFQNEKIRLYERLLTGDICREDYLMEKAGIDTEVEKECQALDAITGQAAKAGPDKETMEAAGKALRKRTLSQELVDMLIDRVLVYPDKQIEIVWKLPGFMDCLTQEGLSVS